MAGGERAPRRRSPRLMRKEELSACASEQDLILMLMREMKDLMDRRREEWALEDRMAGKKVRPLKREMDALMDRLREEWALEDRMAGKKVRSAEQADPANKRKKVVKSKVPKAQIEYMILNPHNSWNGYPEEKLGKSPKKFRELYAKGKARADKFLEYQKALIKQFREKGYADDYTEVTDEEEEKN
ncbi:unnamed protein product [Urochloa humidicola]